jgi:hypothetical protein
LLRVGASSEERVQQLARPGPLQEFSKRGRGEALEQRFDLRFRQLTRQLLEA